VGCEDFLHGFKGTPPARQAGPGPADRMRGRGSHRGESRAGVRESRQKPSGVAGGLAYSGAAACRALRAGAHRARRCRRSAVPAPAGRGFPLRRAPGDRACKMWPGRPPRAGHSVAVQRSPSRALATLASFGWRYAPLLTVIFHGKFRRLSGGRGKIRRSRGVRGSARMLTPVLRHRRCQETACIHQPPDADNLEHSVAAAVEKGHQSEQAKPTAEEKAPEGGLHQLPPWPACSHVSQPSQLSRAGTTVVLARRGVDHRHLPG
jgi:hypothetical protein